MTTLCQLEQQFQNYLLHAHSDILPHILSTTKVPAEVRLQIYEHAYCARLKDALSQSFPVLQCYLGEASFEELTAGFIRAYPSHFKSIRWFGHQLSAYLSQTHPDSPYLAELAQFEWVMALAFDAADTPLLCLEDMQSIPPEAWEGIQFTLHPSVHLLTLSWNVVPIWQAITEDKTAVTLQQVSSKIAWLIWRQDLYTRFSSLPVDEAWALNALQNKASFGELCEGLCQWSNEEEVGLKAASFLKGWISAGLITLVTF